METIVLFLLNGALVGLVSGLLGIGGGLIIVPSLTFLLPGQGIPETDLMRVAVGTALSVILMTSLSSAYAHYQKGKVDLNILRYCFGGLLLGALIGTTLANLLPSFWLKRLFGLFVLCLAWQINQSQEYTQHPLPSPIGLFFIASLISSLCASLGIGGGALIVPFLLRHSVNAHTAIATSAACTVPIALFSVLISLLPHLTKPTHIPGLIGPIYWPAALSIAITSVIFARFGAKLTYRISGLYLKKLFCLFLGMIGLIMLLYP